MEGLTREKSMKFSAGLEFKGKSQEEAAEQIERLYDLFLKVDATQVEINPFVEQPDGRGIHLSSILHILNILSLV